MKAVNLIPGERRRKSRDVVGRSGGAALIVLGLVAGLIALVVMYGSSSHQISRQVGEAAVLTAKTNAVEARTGRLNSYTSFVAMAEQRMRTVSQLVESRFDWSHALHELGRVMPAGTALDSLHGAVGSAGSQVNATSSASSSSSSSTASTSVTSSTPPGSTPTFTVSGCATSQATVAQTLQRLRLMDGVSEVQLQSSTSSGSSSGGGASAGGGSCPAGDPSFTVNVGFAALPAAPAISAPAGVTPAAAHSHGVKVQVSVRSKGTPR